MEITAIEKTIQQALDKLGLKTLNNGTSTGSNFFGVGEIMESYSPVNGKLIGKVSTTTKDDFEKVIKSAEEAYFSDQFAVYW